MVFLVFFIFFITTKFQLEQNPALNLAFSIGYMWLFVIDWLNLLFWLYLLQLPPEWTDQFESGIQVNTMLSLVSDFIFCFFLFCIFKIQQFF